MTFRKKSTPNTWKVLRGTKKDSPRMGITRVNDEIRVECHTRNMGREIKMRNKHKIWWKIHFSVSQNQIQIHQKHIHTHIYVRAPATVIRLICSSHSLFLVDDYSGFGCCCTHHWLEAYASVRVLYRMNFNFFYATVFRIRCGCQYS